MPGFPQAANMPDLYESLVMASVFAFSALAFYLVGRVVTSRPPREEARLKQISHDSPYNGEPEAGVFVAAILVIVPRFYIYFRRRRHMQRIREGLADVIDMLGMCVSGGLPLSSGLEHVARRMTTYPECANELLLLKRQAELGGIKR